MPDGLAARTTRFSNGMTVTNDSCVYEIFEAFVYYIMWGDFV